MRTLKRALDLAIAMTLLVGLSPVLIVLAVLIRWKLGSPVLFVQPRGGFGNRIFQFVKFRSMTSERGPDGKLLPDEQRLTPFGRVLRSSSLDELPQLWNVLHGEISIVGPRPLLASYLPLYDERQRRRHEVPPGITGWAQVNGRNTISWDQKFEYDLWYVDHWSLCLDLKILGLSAINVVRRQGISQQGHSTMQEFRGNPERELRP